MESVLLFTDQLGQAGLVVLVAVCLGAAIREFGGLLKAITDRVSGKRPEAQLSVLEIATKSDLAKLEKKFDDVERKNQTEHKDLDTKIDSIQKDVSYICGQLTEKEKK